SFTDNIIALCFSAVFGGELRAAVLMKNVIDVVQIHRTGSVLRADVWAGLESQASVNLKIHRCEGASREGDANRWQTIARARNEGKKLGSSPWIMFVDDDVVLGPDCVATLLQALEARLDFAALAADYNNEMKPGRGNWEYPPHVGMGATLFRRERLENIEF